MFLCVSKNLDSIVLTTLAMMGLPLMPDSIKAEAQTIWLIPIPGLKAGVNKLFDKREEKNNIDFLPFIRIGIIFPAYYTHQNKTALQFYLQDGLWKLGDNSYGDYLSLYSIY